MRKITIELKKVCVIKQINIDYPISGNEVFDMIDLAVSQMTREYHCEANSIEVTIKIKRL